MSPPGTLRRRSGIDPLAARKLSARADRRQRERAAVKMVRDRERLAQFEPGGAPRTPVEVESASQVEPHALALSCLRCDGPNRLVDHAAVSVENERLRVVRMGCARCGRGRDVWFRISVNLPS